MNEGDRLSLILANSQIFCDNVLYPDFAKLPRICLPDK